MRCRRNRPSKNQQHATAEKVALRQPRPALQTAGTDHQVPARYARYFRARPGSVQLRRSCQWLRRRLQTLTDRRPAQSVCPERLSLCRLSCQPPAHRINSTSTAAAAAAVATVTIHCAPVSRGHIAVSKSKGFTHQIVTTCYMFGHCHTLQVFDPNTLTSASITSNPPSLAMSKCTHADICP